MLKSPRSRILLVLVLVGAVVVGLGMVAEAIFGTAGGGPTNTVSADGASPSALLGTFDKAEFDAYWSSGAVPPSVLANVESVGWDGLILAARTKISGVDADAPDAVRKVCGALSGYWLTSGKSFRTVQVLSDTGVILAARASLSQACMWTL